MRKRKQVIMPSKRSVIPTIEEILALQEREFFIDAPEPTNKYMKSITYVRMFFRSGDPINIQTIRRGIRLGFLDGKVIRVTNPDNPYYQKEDHYLIMDSQSNRDTIRGRSTWRTLHKIKMRVKSKADKELRYRRLAECFMEPFYEEWVDIEDYIVQDSGGDLLYPHSIFPLGFLVDYGIIEPEELKPLREELHLRLREYLDEQGIDDVYLSPTPFQDGTLVNITPILHQGHHVCRIQKHRAEDTYFLRWQIVGRDPSPVYYSINLGEFRPNSSIKVPRKKNHPGKS